MKTKQLFTLFSCIVLAFSFPDPAHAEMQSSITQREFTWTFDKDYECGQFVNGDWWVVGPVTITSVSPQTREAIPEELNDLGENAWGDTGLQDNKTVRNGSMVVMSPGTAQGYDSRGRSFDPATVIEFPYTLEANRSLISSKSNDTIPQRFMFHEMMWGSEKYGKSAIQTASVLTCLEEAPAEDAFRPTYVGAEKRIFRLSDVDLSQLWNLAPTASMPEWETFERYFERPWLDHLNGSWLGQELLPSNLNQPAYGREYARLVSKAALMLHTAAPEDQKVKLLIGLLQLGIDLRGIAELGGHWVEGGGHTSGRKWPILFAGKMFGDPYFKNMPATAVFHEDTETYYGAGWAGQAGLWQIVVHHGVRQPYMHLSPDLWPYWDVEGDRSWATVSEGYRTCCNTQAWVGQTLAALLMGAKTDWNHNAYFDNVDDWMRQEDLYAANRGEGYPRHEWEGSADYFGYDKFVDEMWKAYRSQAPPQEGGTTNFMWNPNGYWMENEIFISLPLQEIEAGETARLSIGTVVASTVASLTISCENLPSFCTLTDPGNGFATLDLAPGAGDEGEYALHLTATSASFTQAHDTVFIKVTPSTTGMGNSEAYVPDIRVYPNPVQGEELSIEIRGGVHGDKFLLSLSDMSGREVSASVHTRSGDGPAILRLPVGELEPGMYILGLSNGMWSAHRSIIVNQ